MINKNNSTRIEGSDAEQRLGHTAEQRRQNPDQEDRIENFGALELDEQVHEVSAQRGSAADRIEEGDEDYDDEEVDNADEIEFEPVTDEDIEEDLDDDELDEDDFEDEDLDDDEDVSDEGDSYTDYGGNSDNNRPAR